MSPKQKNQPKGTPKTKASVRVKKPVREGFFKRNSFKIGLFLIAIVVFANGIGNDYALDDEFYTAGSNKLSPKGIHGLKEIFTSRTFYNNDGTGYAYRPVALATFAIEYQFFGANPHASHFFNLLLYAFTIVLLFSLLRKWFVTQGDWFSFFICLIFLVHPLHTEVVDNIKCRDELLALLFVLLTFHSIWKHLETKKWIYACFFPFLFLAGLLSKETVIPFFLLLPLAMYFFTTPENLSWKNEKILKWVCIVLYLSFCLVLFPNRKYISIAFFAVTVFLWFANEKFWKIALYIAPLLLTAVLTTYFEKHNLESETRHYLLFENPLAAHHGFAYIAHASATSFYVIARYLLLHLFPYPLLYYYGANYIPTITWSNPIAIASLIVHVVLAYWAFKELRKKSILGFGLLFYLINIAIYSNIVKPAPGIMAERFTYAASLGFCIVLVVLIFRFMKVDPIKFRWKQAEYKKIRFAFIFIAAVLSARTVWRTSDWKDKKTLYGNDMDHLSESVKANMLYGALISKDALDLNAESRVPDGKGGFQINPQKKQESNQLFVEARDYYAKAAELAPYYHTAWSNLGTAYFFTGETRTALSYFLRGIKIKSDYSEAWFNAAMAYDKLEMNDSAVYSFSQSIKFDSSYVSSYEQLSRLILQKEKNPNKALELLKTAARHKPDSEVPWNNMANVYLQMGDTAKSAAAVEMAAKINPNNLQRLYNLAQYYKIHGDVSKYNYYISLAEKGRAKQQQLEKEKQDD